MKDQVLEHIKNSSTGAITATRSSLSDSISLERDRKLLAQLMTKGYLVIEIYGSYIESFNTPQALEVKQNLLFVVDSKSSDKLEKDLFELGVEYGQDSILFIPKGGEEAFLIGTNTNLKPGLGIKLKTGDSSLSLPEGSLLSKTQGRPFIFSEAIELKHPPGSWMGRWACSLAAKKDLSTF